MGVRRLEECLERGGEVLGRHFWTENREGRKGSSRPLRRLLVRRSRSRVADASLTREAVTDGWGLQVDRYSLVVFFGPAPTYPRSVQGLLLAAASVHTRACRQPRRLPSRAVTTSRCRSSAQRYTVHDRRRAGRARRASGEGLPVANCARKVKSSHHHGGHLHLAPPICR